MPAIHCVGVDRKIVYYVLVSDNYYCYCYCCCYYYYYYYTTSTV